MPGYKLTNLEIFVCQEMDKQGKKSLLVEERGRTVCRYRTTDQDNPEKILKCAAGVLIKDEEYKEAMEGTSFDNVMFKDIIWRLAEEFNMTIHEVTRTVLCLQQYHDTGWLATLESFSSSYVENLRRRGILKLCN